MGMKTLQNSAANSPESRKPVGTLETPGDAQGRTGVALIEALLATLPGTPGV